jgi:hypothetical protein
VPPFLFQNTVILSVVTVKEVIVGVTAFLATYVLQVVDDESL